MNQKSNIKHYASQYYDPAKAHEYYLKNRELKGRQKMSGEQVDAWDYTKGKISTAKNAKVKNSQAVRDQQIEQLQIQASEARKRITDKIKLLNKKLSRSKVANLEAERAKISSELKALVKNVRDEYEKAKANIDSEFKNVSAKERQNIIDNVSGASTKRGKREVWRLK